jgi:hypothetical protein
VTLVHVCWLERGREYPKGRVDRRVHEGLELMRRDPWQPFVAGGAHECGLCQFHGEARGSANLFIPGDRLTYFCPELIVHYINAHHYLPPEVFAVPSWPVRQCVRRST